MSDWFFLKPQGAIQSLSKLTSTDGLLKGADLTRTIAGESSKPHRLIVAELAGGKVMAELRLALTKDNQAIGGVQQLVGNWETCPPSALQSRHYRLPRHCPGTALLLGTWDGQTYYHWMLDCLPRWQLLVAAGMKDYDYVLLNTVLTRWHLETLTPLGIPGTKRLCCSRTFLRRFDRLVVPAMPFPQWEVATWACQWLATVYGKHSSHAPERVYISRRAAWRRRLVNEAALEAELACRGFAVAQPEQFSVTEQARLFSRARCVVAPHGAGLTNLVFAPPGATMLELFHPAHKFPCYQHLAAACGHYYASLDGVACQSVNNRNPDYEVNIPAVLQAVTKMI
jgi:capsular polysaccharide biosynthesis protein